MDDKELAMRAMWPDGRPDGVAPPLHRDMGLQLKQLDPTTVLTMEINDTTRGLAPVSVHGGMLATFADVASAVSLWKYQNAQVNIPVTIDMHIRYYRQPKAGPLTAEVEVVHAGRQLLSAECLITDAEQRVLARTAATFMLVPVATA
ncbi:MAG TPA: PaaI family thioesterase [Mycobacteriales bacterium]|nr:PaaI family thioesterase [Mycobacteriales bacterium]